MEYPMKYPAMPDYGKISGRLAEFARLKYEYGADRDEIEKALAGAKAAMAASLDKLLALPEDAALAAVEPDALDAIKQLRPSAERSLWKAFDRERYADRLAGACRSLLLSKRAGFDRSSPRSPSSS